MIYGSSEGTYSITPIDIKAATDNLLNRLSGKSWLCVYICDYIYQVMQNMAHGINEVIAGHVKLSVAVHGGMILCCFLSQLSTLVESLLEKY